MSFGKVKQIACARVKTDKRDTLILARLLAAKRFPITPENVGQLRAAPTRQPGLLNSPHMAMLCDGR
jgi:hypothetical protein